MSDYIYLTTEDIQKIVMAAWRAGRNDEYIFRFFILPNTRATENGIGTAVESGVLIGASQSEPIPEVIIYE